MRLRVLTLLGLIALAACSTTAGGSPNASTASTTRVASPSLAQATPTRPTHTGPYAIITDAAFSQGGFSNYNVIIIDGTGNIVTYKRPKVPSGAPGGFPQAPLVSASNTRAYYLNDYEIDYLAPDGSSGNVFTLPGDLNTRYAFAVSPDDKRLAVAALVYLPPSTFGGVPTVTLDLYIQDLTTGANKVDLFTSTSVVEWPIGWHAGNLVVAVGRSGDQGAIVPRNPYFGQEYHVADPATGNRLAVLGQDYKGDFGNGCNWGPLVAAGAACMEYDALRNTTPITKVTMSIQGWDGTKRTLAMLPLSSNDYTDAVLSPAGDRMAVLDTAVSQHLVYVTASGFSSPGVKCDPKAWLDATHLLCRQPPPVGPYAYFVLNTNTNTQGGIEGEFTVSEYTRFIATIPQQMG